MGSLSIFTSGTVETLQSLHAFKICSFLLDAPCPSPGPRFQHALPVLLWSDCADLLVDSVSEVRQRWALPSSQWAFQA